MGAVRRALRQSSQRVIPILGWGGGGSDFGVTQDPPGEGLGAVEPLFTFECGSHNIGALVENRAAIAVPCTLVATDASGRALPHTPTRVFAEAGELLQLAADADSGPRIVYAVGA